MAVRGRMKAVEYHEVLRRRRIQALSLGQLQTEMRSLVGTLPDWMLSARLEMRRLGKVHRKDFDEDPFVWISKQRGRWIARLVEVGVVDHCVFVDGRRRLIWDCVEEYPVALTADTLRLCGGPNARHLQVREVREVVPQKEKKTSTEKQVVTLE